MERKCMNFFNFFYFVSSCVRYVYGEPMYTGYVLKYILQKLTPKIKLQKHKQTWLK
jgi:hypothetical protein